MDPICREIVRKGIPGSESQRLFHGRGHTFPGYDDLLIDWFSPVVLVTLYRPREDTWLHMLAGWLTRYTAAESVVVQQRYLSRSPSCVVAGTLPENVDAVENGLNYRLRLNDAQNIGFFLDMAQGRKIVREGSVRKKILNLFSYTCSFSVAALAGGAEQVVNIDMSRGALQWGRLNHHLNNLDLRRASFLPYDIFKSFGRLKKLGPFDLIICDPPGEQGNSFRPLRDWPKLARKLPELLTAEGELLLCVSSPHIDPSYIADLFQTGEVIGHYRSGDDFPEAEADKGLNILHYRYFAKNGTI